MLSAPAADMDAEFVRKRPQPALEGTDNTGRDSGRVPVHAHDCAERLEPEWMGQPLQEFVASVVVDNGLCDDGTEGRHARLKPGRYSPSMKRKNCTSGSFCHSNRKIPDPGPYQS